MKISFLLFVLLVLNSCTNIDSNLVKKINQKDRLYTGFKLENNQIQKHDIITLTTAFEVDISYKGTIGTKDITLIKVASKTLAFVVPEMPQGEYTLAFQLGSSCIELIEPTVAIQNTSANTLPPKLAIFNKSHRKR